MTKIEADLIEALKASLNSVPESYRDAEPVEAWKDIAACFVVEMTKRGIYFKAATEHDIATISKRSTDGRSRRPALCQEVLLGVGQCVKVAGHRGQHQLQTGDNFG